MDLEKRQPLWFIGWTYTAESTVKGLFFHWHYVTTDLSVLAVLLIFLIR